MRMISRSSATGVPQCGQVMKTCSLAKSVKNSIGIGPLKVTERSEKETSCSSHPMQSMVRSLVDSRVEDIRRRWATL
jgi:hypothetical protein